MVTYLLKTFSLMFALILFGFASLQFNDPDPLPWIGFYVLCALVSLLLVFNIFYSSLFWLAVAACLLRLLIVGSGAFEYLQHMDQEPLMQAMNPNKPYIEEAREFLGAFIALGFISCSALMAPSRYLTGSIRSVKNKEVMASP